MGPSQEALMLARSLLKDRSPEEVANLEIELAYFLQSAGDKWVSGDREPAKLPCEVCGTIPG